MTINTKNILNLKMWILAVFTFFIFYIISSLVFYLKNHKAVYPFLVKIDFSDVFFTQVNFYSIFNKKCAVNSQELGHYESESEYIGRCEIVFPNDQLQNIRKITIENGKERYIIDRDKFDSLFSIKKNENDIYLSLSSKEIKCFSFFPFFKKCINWKGDVRVFFESIIHFFRHAVFALFGVLLSWGLWSVIFIENKSEFFRKININYTKIISLIVIIYLFATFLWIKRAYQMNDDSTISSMLMHGYPSPYIGGFLVKLLIFLYQRIPYISWYGWLLYFSCLISLLLFLYTMSLCVTNRFFAIFVIIPLLIMFIPALSNMTFTQSAILLSGSSLSAFIAYLYYIDKIKITNVIGFGLLFGLGFEIRSEATALVVVFLFPFLLFLCYLFYKEKKNLVFHRLKLSILFLIPVFSFFCLEIFYIPSTYSPEQKAYNEFNAIRGKLHDYEVLRANKKNQELLKENNWSENDYLMFHNWMFFDEKKFSIEKIKNIYARVLNTHPLSTSSISQKVTSFISKLLICLISCSVFMIVLYVMTNNKFFYFKNIFSLFYLFYCLILFLFLELFLKLPFRVYFPMFIVISHVFILLLFSKQPQIGFEYLKRRNQFFLLITVSLLILFNSVIVCRHQMKQESRHKYFSSLTANLSKKFTDKVIFQQPPVSLGQQVEDPFFMSKERPYHIVPSGWLTFSPFFYANLKSIGLKNGHELFINLFSNSNFYFIGNETGADILTKYLQENFDGDIMANKIEWHQNYPLVLQFKQ